MNSEGELVAKVYNTPTKINTFKAIPVFNSQHKLIAYTTLEAFLDVGSSLENQEAKYKVTCNLNV